MLRAREAAQLLRPRQRRAYQVFEEAKQGHLERECIEELCSQEEAREVFENDPETVSARDRGRPRARCWAAPRGPPSPPRTPRLGCSRASGPDEPEHKARGVALGPTLTPPPHRSAPFLPGTAGAPTAVSRCANGAPGTQFSPSAGPLKAAAFGETHHV